MTNSSSPASRSVSFNVDVRCIRALHINNYTDEEITDTWFTKTEYKQMKREIKLTVGMMDKKSRFAEGINFSSRGLEDKTADMIVQKVEHRFLALDAVLDEQDRQREAGICDAEALRLVYTEYSFVSHMSAFLMATLDEKMAMGGYDTTTSTSCKASSAEKQDSASRTTSLSNSYRTVFRIPPSHRVSMAA
eukprot:CAMPEP_0117022308 /NCGR_PEP_ID=MMETSP0472-20121206/16777_1 /TAXON_ID=693140 ORGANISM="Tiarina fusus, Strain LIS" /NCGR_SAMPLE_ID=MMETSP0472 /ASSEMBLY_ACC=CAM_ASM_000603 /LENGTH=190 /DNA_ID=CAMNT_0004728125 /DNA_START=52 /DNA_END=624 /DNA_ORIENTATION=-